MLQLPEPRRGPEDHTEPAAANIPAVSVDVDTGELITAQLPQILGMHDASEDSQYGRAPASRRAAIRTSAGVSTLTTTAWAHAVLDDHRDGQASPRAGSPPTSGPIGEPCAMARTREVECPDRGWNIRVGPARIDGEVDHAVISVPAGGTYVETAADFQGPGTLNRAGGVSVLPVVEHGSGPVATRSGAVILPRNRMP